MQIAPGPESLTVEGLLSPKRDEALARLLDLCESDTEVAQVMGRHKLSREDLESFHRKLTATGAGQWAGRHYIPASAIVHAPALEFLYQKHESLPWQLISVLLIEYFERDETGPVPTELRGPSDPSDPLNAIWKLREQSGSSE